ncbi:MAG: c-type cytochrome domain-containing protein, partial [Limisphaerales bacterium]
MRFEISTGLLSVLLVVNVAHAADKPVNFAREVLPILSDKCFACHGPDTKKKNELRLDSPAATTADRGGYKAVDPAVPEESELLARIFDTDDPMPPADAERQLSAREKQT